MVLERLTYAEQLSFALQIRAYYLIDRADFQNFNAVRFHAQWETDWEQAILVAQNQMSDDNMVDLGTTRTQTVNTLMEGARKLYQKHIKIFIEDAFVNKIGMQNHFGINDYDDIRSNAAKMLLFLNNLYLRSNDHFAALTQAGMRVTIPQEVKTIHD
ncbi:MAG: hypothetical protein ACRCSG_01345, partial [Cellulosilyticaceae bacterium]